MTKFFVPGVPKPKGSTKAFYNPKANRVVTKPACKESKPWQSLVSWAAKEAKVPYVDDKPISLIINFGQPRPKGHFNGKGELKKTAPVYPIVRNGDIDKLSRLVLDSLTGIAYRDDSQVCDIYSTKEYTMTPGVLITVDTL